MMAVVRFVRQLKQGGSVRERVETRDHRVLVIKSHIKKSLEHH